MIVVGVGAFVGLQFCFDIVVVGGNFGGKLSFLQSIINNLVGFANPTTFGLVSLVWIQMFMSICHV